jgi:hypothetical protein
MKAAKRAARYPVVDGRENLDNLPGSGIGQAG